jgi:type I restriction enzyme S subunit
MSKSPPKPPSSSKAPRGRTIPAQGKEPRDAALGPPPPQNPSPEGAGQLPVGWETVTIGESLELINGRAFKPNEWTTSGRPIIRIQNLNNTKASFNYYAGELPAKFIVSTGDLLFAWSGTPGTSFGAHLWKGPEAWLNQHIFKVLFPVEVFDKSFLQLAINQNLAEYIGVAHGGAGLAHITKGKFEASSLPLPPLAEQKRMVSKIEELFSELDAGEESLRRARRQLGVYRQSLLKQAFEGKLTAPWRKQNPHLLESPDELSNLIQGRSKKSKSKANVPHPIKGWVFRCLDELTEFVTSGSRGWADYYSDSGSLFVRAQNLNRDFLNLTSLM